MTADHSSSLTTVVDVVHRHRRTTSIRHEYLQQDHNRHIYYLTGREMPPPVIPAAIRSSIMSHITLKMCQFVLIIYLRDYHYYFHLDIVVLWSFYGVLRLTYLHIKIYVRLITFSDDFSCPKTSVPIGWYY